MSTIRDKYCIVGVGETEFSRNSGRTTRAMAVEAVRNAMNDAGLLPDEVDGMLSYHTGDSTNSGAVSNDLGIRLNFFMDCSGGGSSTEALVGLAMGAIEVGMCHTVAIYRSMNGYSQWRTGGTGSRGAAPVTGEAVVRNPYGWVSAAQLFAFNFMRHMMEYGTTSAQVAQVKVVHSRHASQNPKAVEKGRVTVEEVLSSRCLNAYRLMLPSTVSTAAIAPSPQFKGRLDWLAAQASNPTVRSRPANQSHFPHRRPRHPA